MAKLIYASNISVDGCTEDERGAFDWAPSDDDVFAFITELMRSAGTYLYGRRMYETLALWETDSTLAAPLNADTRLERHFDPGAVLDTGLDRGGRDSLPGTPLDRAARGGFGSA